MLPLPLLVILTPRMLVLPVVLAVPVPRPTALPSVGLCKWLRVAAMTARTGNAPAARLLTHRRHRQPLCLETKGVPQTAPIAAAHCPVEAWSFCGLLVVVGVD